MSAGIESALENAADIAASGDGADSQSASRCDQSGLKALHAVARHWGLDISLVRLLHVHGKDREPDAAELVRIAEAEGLKASVRTIDWSKLERFQKLAPFLVRLNGGGYFVVLKTGAVAQGPDGAEQIVLFNPRVPEANLFPVTREDFLRYWSGEVVLLKRVYRLDDTNRRFGLGWFVPEIWRQHALLRNVVIAALAMHVLALAVPIFFQIVIDRVLIYLSISTLVVISVGVVLAILFDSTFNWLRGYFVLRTASRIDIRLARTTFQHLMSLPISFFDTARAGVVTKHMQQGVTIREFLTGRLLTTLLDFPALIVFLPLMAWYSGILTLVVLLVALLLGLVIAVMLG